MLDYYLTAGAASKKIDGHPGLIYLQKLCQSAEKILDAGCGEGSRLHTLLPKNKSGWGIDISESAIKLAKKQYPEHVFNVSTPLRFPHPDSSFDLVYSAFVLEHTIQPYTYLTELFRVCRTGGQIVILAPNFGAPNRRSPNSTENPLLKLFKSKKTWTTVIPKKVYNQIDDDTTVEPYLLTLKSHILNHKSYINTASALWELEPNSLNPRKQIVKMLGIMGIYPFNYWGPQIFLAATKL